MKLKNIKYFAIGLLFIAFIAQLVSNDSTPVHKGNEECLSCHVLSSQDSVELRSAYGNTQPGGFLPLFFSVESDSFDSYGFSLRAVNKDGDVIGDYLSPNTNLGEDPVITRTNTGAYVEHKNPINIIPGVSSGVTWRAPMDLNSDVTFILDLVLSNKNGNPNDDILVTDTLNVLSELTSIYEEDLDYRMNYAISDSQLHIFFDNWMIMTSDMKVIKGDYQTRLRLSPGSYILFDIDNKKHKRIVIW